VIFLAVVTSLGALTPTLVASSTLLNNSTPQEIPQETPPTIQMLEENINAYEVDEILFEENYNYSSALKADIERDFYVTLAGDSQRITDAVYTYSKNLNKDLVFA